MTPYPTEKKKKSGQMTQKEC
uniref:Uncharacterized protein n=1 Tax=Rhizophora mucronata TaxID=61149 RepID=A0A2P2PBG4_RHIMU